MNKEKFAELACLYLMDELQTHEKVELENEMMQDDELKNEFDSIKETFFAIRNNKPIATDERLLVSARQSLMRNIRQASHQKSSIAGLLEKIKYFFYHNYGLALGGVITLVVSIGIAYMLFLKTAQHTSNAVANNSFQDQAIKDYIPDKQTSRSISDQTFDKYGKSSSGFRESIINALLNSQNAGIRIKSISTLSDRVKEEIFSPDTKIKQALVTAMKRDENPTVRREALTVLQKFPFDNQIRDALLYVLSKDKNSGMRVAAINALADWNKEQRIIDEILKQALAKQAQVNNNTFVKIRAASILKEVE